MTDVGWPACDVILICFCISEISCFSDFTAGGSESAFRLCGCGRCSSSVFLKKKQIMMAQGQMRAEDAMTL